MNDADTKTTSTTAKVVPPTLGGERHSLVLVWEGPLATAGCDSFKPALKPKATRAALHLMMGGGCCCALLRCAFATVALTSAPRLPPSAHLMSGPWTNYKLTVCQAGTDNCKTFNCAPAKIAACPLTGLTPNTFYSVTVVAQKTGAPDSLISKADTFKTLSDA